MTKPGQLSTPADPTGPSEMVRNSLALVFRQKGKRVFTRKENNMTRSISTLSEPKIKTSEGRQPAPSRAENPAPTHDPRPTPPLQDQNRELSTLTFNRMFSLWFEGCRGFVHICSSKNWPGVFLEIPASAPDDPLEPSFRGASRLPDGYFSTCTFKSERRRTYNVKDIPGIWADLDFKRFVGDKEEADERLKRIPFEPSILVCSGSGYHAFWRFCQPQLPSHETIALLKHFTEVLHGDPATTHYAALLRIPGTINSKYGQTRVEIDRRSSWKTYSFQEVLSFARKSGLLVDGTSQDRSAVCV